MGGGEPVMTRRRERSSIPDHFLEYTLTLDLDPPGIFGIPEETVVLRPSPAEGIDDERVNHDYLLSGRAVSQPLTSPKRRDVEWNDIALSLTGNRLELRVDALRSQDAFMEFQFVLGELLRLWMAKIGFPIRYRVVGFRDEAGKEYRYPRPRVGWAAFYDEQFMLDAFSESVTALQLQDEVLRRALHYFEGGCRFFDLWSDYVERSTVLGKSEDRLPDTLWSCGFLQFWKSITVVLEEPSSRSKRDRTFKGRARALKLSAAEVNLVRELVGVRNDFDVSHRAYDQYRSALPRRNVRVVQAMAQRVILSYIARLQAGKPGFGPHPLRLMSLREGRPSSFRVLARPKGWRVAKFGVAVT